MSVIVAMCGSNYVKMVSDGRVIRIDPDGQYVPYNENYNKLRKLNENIIIGFAGDKTLCEVTVRKLKKVINPKDYLNDAHEKLIDILVNLKLKKLKVMMLLGGISSDRKYILATYSSDDGFNPIVYQPKVCEHYLRIALPFGVLSFGVLSDYNKLINKYFKASPKKSERFR